MIIGISGKIGSGKDTVGKIIQSLVTKDYGVYLNQIDYINGGDYVREKTSGWEVKKFAGKLKDITCLLIGCTREELEDQTFKNTPLSEDWTKYGIVRKDGSRIIDIQGSREEAEKRLSVWGEGAKIEKIELTPRLLLQLLGTEAGREIIHPNIWVNALFADYIPYSTRGSDYEEVESNWLITDMRFPNEKKAVEARGGITIRINRDTELRYPKLWADFTESNEDSWDDYLKNKGLFDNVYHLSETALDSDDKWCYEVFNNGSLEDLIEQIRVILQKEKLIS